MLAVTLAGDLGCMWYMMLPHNNTLPNLTGIGGHKREMMEKSS